MAMSPVRWVASRCWMLPALVALAFLDTCAAVRVATTAKARTDMAAGRSRSAAFPHASTATTMATDWALKLIKGIGAGFEMKRVLGGGDNALDRMQALRIGLENGTAMDGSADAAVDSDSMYDLMERRDVSRRELATQLSDPKTSAQDAVEVIEGLLEVASTLNSVARSCTPDLLMSLYHEVGQDVKQLTKDVKSQLWNAEGGAKPGVGVSRAKEKDARDFLEMKADVAKHFITEVVCPALSDALNMMLFSYTLTNETEQSGTATVADPHPPAVNPQTAAGEENHKIRAFVGLLTENETPDGLGCRKVYDCGADLAVGAGCVKPTVPTPPPPSTLAAAAVTPTTARSLLGIPGKGAGKKATRSLFGFASNAFNKATGVVGALRHTAGDAGCKLGTGQTVDVAQGGLKMGQQAVDQGLKVGKKAVGQGLKVGGQAVGQGRKMGERAVGRVLQHVSSAGEGNLGRWICLCGGGGEANEASAVCWGDPNTARSRGCLIPVVLGDAEVTAQLHALGLYFDPWGLSGDVQRSAALRKKWKRVHAAVKDPIETLWLMHGDLDLLSTGHKAKAGFVGLVGGGGTASQAFTAVTAVTALLGSYYHVKHRLEVSQEIFGSEGFCIWAAHHLSGKPPETEEELRSFGMLPQDGSGSVLRAPSATDPETKE